MKQARKVILAMLTVALSVQLLTAGSCQNQEQKEITLANVGLVLNKSINTGLRDVRSARNAGLIPAETYHTILNRIESAQNITDELNKQLDSYAMVDTSNKASLIAAFAKASSGIEPILSDPIFNGLPPDLRKGIIDKAKYAKVVLSIAANVVGLIEKPTSSKSVSFTVKGVE